MCEERIEEETPWPPFSPNLELIIDFEKGRPKEELEAILEEAARRRKGEATETAPEKPT